MKNTVSLEQKKEHIKKQACFSKLTDAETTQLAELFVETHVKPGEVLTTEGDHVDSVFIIVKGSADVRHVTIQNKKPNIKSVASLSEGAAIGLNETGFFSLSGLRTATVVALTDMTLLRLSLAAFHGFALAYPHVSQIMRKNVAEALRK